MADDNDNDELCWRWKMIANIYDTASKACWNRYLHDYYHSVQ